MNTLSETIELPPSDRTLRERAEAHCDDYAVMCWVFLAACVLFLMWVNILNMERLKMKDDIANAWTKLKAKRDAEQASHAADVKMLRDQIDADGLSDADRAAIEEMKTEAAK